MGLVNGCFGIVFVLVLTASNLLPTAPPHADADVGAIARYFRQHHTAFLVALVLQGLSFAPLLLFAGGLRQHLNARARVAPFWTRLAFGAGVGTAAVALSVAPFWAVLAFRQGAGGVDVIRALFDLGNLGYNLIGFPFAVFSGAASAAMLYAGNAWRWIGGYGLTVCIAQGVAASSFAHAGPFAPGGTIFLVTFLQFSLWVVAAAVALCLDARRGTGSALNAGTEQRD